MELISERMIFESITLDDVDLLHSLYGDSDLTRYFVSGADKDRSSSRTRVVKIKSHWDTHGFGDFLAFEKRIPFFENDEMERL